MRPSHTSFAWLSQNILSRLLVIDLQAGNFRTIPAMKYRPAVYLHMNQTKSKELIDESIADLQKMGTNCRLVAIIQQRTWTNGKARSHVSSLHSLLMQLCALEAHIRISRNLEKFVDLMRNHRSGPEPSPCPLQAQASGPKISGNLILGCNGSA